MPSHPDQEVSEPQVDSNPAHLSVEKSSDEASPSSRENDSGAPKFKLQGYKEPKALMKHISTANFIERHKRMSMHKKTSSLPPEADSALKIPSDATPLPRMNNLATEQHQHLEEAVIYQQESEQDEDSEDEFVDLHCDGIPNELTERASQMLIS